MWPREMDFLGSTQSRGTGKKQSLGAQPWLHCRERSTLEACQSWWISSQHASLSHQQTRKPYPQLDPQVLTTHPAEGLQVWLLSHTFITVTTQPVTISVDTHPASGSVLGTGTRKQTERHLPLVSLQSHTLWGAITIGSKDGLVYPREGSWSQETSSGKKWTLNK